MSANFWFATAKVVNYFGLSKYTQIKIAIYVRKHKWRLRAKDMKY